MLLLSSNSKINNFSGCFLYTNIPCGTLAENMSSIEVHQVMCQAISIDIDILSVRLVLVTSIDR